MAKKIPSSVIDAHIAKALSAEIIDGEIYRRSYYEFFKAAWSILKPGEAFEDNWHVRYLCDYLQGVVEGVIAGRRKELDVIINIPPRTLKSMLVTVTLNAWAWANSASLKFITASYSAELSLEHAVATRRLIESEWYQKRYPHVKLRDDQNVKSRFDTTLGGSRRSTSVGGTITGQGGDIIIIDDPHKVEESKSDILRNGVIDWYNKTLYSRLNDQKVGVRILVMQRLHEDDLTGFLLRTAPTKYFHVCLPAKLTRDVSPREVKRHYKQDLLFPTRFDNEVLEGFQTSLGSREFAGQYLQSPAPEEGNLIKEAWFKWFIREDVPENLTKHFFTDAAYGKEESDNSATICYSRYNNNLYIWGCYAWNLAFPDFIKRYKLLIESLGNPLASKCYFEPKASGTSMVQEMKSSTRLNIIEASSPKDSKVSRVQTASARIEAGRVFLYKDGVGLSELIHEATVFPGGKNDDRIDALASIINSEVGNGAGRLLDSFSYV